MAFPTIKLEVDDKGFEGWQSVSVSAGMDRAVRTFRVGAATRRRTLVPGSACRLILDGVPVVTGYVDTVRESYTATSHHTFVSGRSRTADLVDCVVEPRWWTDHKNINVAELAARLAEPYNVDVVLQSTRTIPKIPKHGIEAATQVFAVVESLCREVRLLAMDDAEGRLILTDAGQAGRVAKSLVVSRHGWTVLQGEMESNFSQRFSRYEVRGETGFAFDGTEENKPVKGIVFDKAVTRTRNLYFMAEDNVDIAKAEARAKWEANVRAGKSLRFSVRANRWTDPDGNLWEPNKVVRYHDQILNVDRELVVVSVDLSVDSQGVVSSLVLVLLAAYTPEPVDVAEVVAPDAEGGAGNRVFHETVRRAAGGGV